MARYKNNRNTVALFAPVVSELESLSSYYYFKPPGVSSTLDRFTAPLAFTGTPLEPYRPRAHGHTDEERSVIMYEYIDRVLSTL